MFEFVVQWVKDNIRREDGQTMAEYGIILGVITVGAIAAILLIGGYVTDQFNAVAKALGLE